MNNYHLMKVFIVMTPRNVVGATIELPRGLLTLGSSMRKHDLQRPPHWLRRAPQQLVTDSEHGKEIIPHRHSPHPFRRNESCFQLFLCLSRACLGKSSDFSIKWRNKHVISAPPNRHLQAASDSARREALQCLFFCVGHKVDPLVVVSDQPLYFVKLDHRFELQSNRLCAMSCHMAHTHNIYREKELLNTLSRNGASASASLVQ